MNRFALTLIGFGLWLCADKRTPFRTTSFRLTGFRVVGQLNRQNAQDELARRHAKPSSRKRVG